MPQLSEHLRVRCTAKADKTAAHERLVAIGGINPDGARWKLNHTKAVEGIESGTWQFWIRHHDKSVRLVVALGPDGTKYLASENIPIGVSDPLFDLPDCP